MEIYNQRRFQNLSLQTNWIFFAILEQIALSDQKQWKKWNWMIAEILIKARNKMSIFGNYQMKYLTEFDLYINIVLWLTPARNFMASMSWSFVSWITLLMSSLIKTSSVKLRSSPILCNWRIELIIKKIFKINKRFYIFFMLEIHVWLS